MRYRYIDAAEQASATLRQDALNAECLAMQLEVTAAGAKGQQATDLRARAAETKKVAATKVKKQRLTSGEVADAKRIFLENWISAMEREHASQSTMVEIKDSEGQGDASAAHAKTAKELEPVIRAAYKAFDALPKVPAVAGDGGTANRQVRRTRARAAKKA